MFILTNPFQCYLSVSVQCVRVFARVCVCVLFVYTISIGISVSIICVSQEDVSLIASNQQICDFYKLVVFEKKRHIGKYNLYISELFIQCNTGSCCEHITGDVNIFILIC